MDYDYLIVGQGLAGTSLAWHLHQCGKKFLIVNDSTRPAASLVAAGIFNPLTGRKLVKTWLADELFPYARRFYGELEETLQARFLHYINIYRPYRSVEEQNSYLAQTAEPGIGPYIQQPPANLPYNDYLYAPHGGLEVTGSGWVDLPLFLLKSQEYFQQGGQYREGFFNPDDMVLSGDTVEWNGLRIGKVIFCQGVDALSNTLFNWLPFNPVKGQILEIALDKYPIDRIVNQGIFILPDGEGKCRLGATYSWHDLDWETTEEGRQYLEEKAKGVLKVPYQVLKQRAGLRPSSKDRRPLVGFHPQFQQVGVFNGLGTKGVTLAPYFAANLVEYMEKGKDLNLLVNIGRYFSLYYQ
ncbi:FAD-dependent oxidoreductase [Telluribacter sp.]|jgi:glycine/D-amino acid oxidase-like deaminating enzyme|uniref:NAD(P)/FAD-dependent oxidoreductase n=1 Tax=Telluribacter sp. TaxID=1978767 RepID=UPI002E142382|nr:FAD-dependent oxidoreductase [Telluribacter sp.]